MKVSMNWLKEYAAVPMNDADYQSRMIMTGTGVEGMDDLRKTLENVVVGRVVTCVDHPNSDHLHICSVDAGTGELLQIVCGAPNVKEGLLVPVAKVGAKLPGGIEIKKGKLRGVESCGMLCSAAELNVPVELYPSIGEAGLLVFNEEYPVGTDVREIFGFNDTVIDFEILANRPDCLCVWGVARETAAAMGTELKLPEINVIECENDDISKHASVDVQNNTLCPRYAARVVKNVRIAPSPLWMRQYLHAAGMRSINNIVDITNFIMLETGHPMHAFDLSKVRGKHIIVRNAVAGESLTTLDGKLHPLQGGELVICDQEAPTGLAGIMGGEESEITEETCEILFECASFDRTHTRITARNLGGIRTESSGRFERGVSPATVMPALQRACQMVNILDAGDVVPGIIDIYPAPLVPITLVVSCRRMAERAGVAIAPEEMESILKKLLFAVSRDGDSMTVTAPDFRQDIEREADICEEVLRYAGYERIPSTALSGQGMMGGRSEKMRREDSLRDMLSGLGYYESMTFSFISQKAINQLNLPLADARNHPLALRNSLGEDTACMRTTLLCGLLKTLATNIKNGNENGKLYEMGTVYDPSRTTAEGLPTEVPCLAIGCYGENADFYHLRSVVEALFARVGVSCDIAASEEACLHPGRRAALQCGGEVLCTLGEVHPDVLQNYDIDGRACAAHIDLSLLWKYAAPMDEVKGIARTPAVQRDLALVMDEAQPVGPVMAAMRSACGELLETIALFDVFRGKQLGEGKKSVAFALSFRAADHTLTEDEIHTLVAKVLTACEKQFGAVLRS